MTTAELTSDVYYVDHARAVKDLFAAVALASAGHGDAAANVLRDLADAQPVDPIPSRVDDLTPIARARALLERHLIQAAV